MRAESAGVTRWRLLVGGSVSAAGVGIICFGGLVDGLSDYLTSVCINVGTAVVLVGPLLVVERLLSSRINDARDRASAAEVSATAARETSAQTQQHVDDLTARVHRALGDLRAQDRRRHKRLLESQTQENLVTLYKRAARNNSIDRRGLRVAVDLLEWWLLVRVVSCAPDGDPIDLVEFTFEDAGLRPVGNTVVWSPGEDVTDIFVRLATELQQRNAWPGDDAFQPGAIVEAIADALAHVIDIRTGRRGDAEVRSIIELVSEDWAVTREGLDSLITRQAWAEHHELLDDTSHAWNRLRAQSKTLGLDDFAFRQAFNVAEHIHQAFERQSPPNVGR